MNMKTRNLLLLGAAAFAAIALNVNAADALLAPRAAGNQIKVVAGADNNLNLASPTAIAISPRTLANQTKTVAGTSNVNPATLCASHMTAGPKVVQACAANPTAAMPCCTKTVAAAK